MDIPEEFGYTAEHEWVAVEDGMARIGITDYAQSELGDIVFVELPEVGDETTQMEPFGTIEAVKAVSDLFAPVSGKVVEVNTLLEDQPELINTDPYGEGWILKIKLKDESEAQKLLSAEEYRKEIS
ncbi:glycine cleavage system protein GcvH [candidate division KSB1 bacterium]|nr:glycine cleavage system protein GcvH [candidate division KSB1 bacterium]